MGVLNERRTRYIGFLMVSVSIRSSRLTAPTSARITPISLPSSSLQSASSAPMVSALITIPSSARLTWISVISFLIRASTSSRLPRMTKNGEPAITPSRLGAVTLIPEAAATDFTRSNRSSTRISFMGRGFKSDRTFVTTTSPCVATAISSPIARVPS